MKDPFFYTRKREKLTNKFWFHQKALAIDPNLQEALIGLAKTQRDLGKFALADEARKKALQINPNNQVAIGLASTISGGGSHPRFICDVSNSIPTTIAMLPIRGKVPLIRWSSDYSTISGYSPQKSCELVSERFQIYYSNGSLKYITNGIMNGRSVICVTDRKGDYCRGELFAIKPGTDGKEILEKLFSIDRSTSSNPIVQ